MLRRQALSYFVIAGCLSAGQPVTEPMGDESTANSMNEQG